MSELGRWMVEASDEELQKFLIEFYRGRFQLSCDINPMSMLNQGSHVEITTAIFEKIAPPAVYLERQFRIWKSKRIVESQGITLKPFTSESVQPTAGSATTNGKARQFKDPEDAKKFFAKDPLPTEIPWKQTKNTDIYHVGQDQAPRELIEKALAGETKGLWALKDERTGYVRVFKNVKEYVEVEK